MPGPRGDWLAGNLAAYEKDRLGWLLEARRDFGPVVRFDRTTTVVNDPDAVRTVLMNRSGAFAIRHNLLQERIRDDELGAWTDVRRLLNPHLRLRAASPSAPMVARVTAEALAATGGRTVPATSLFEQITATVVATQFFGPEHGDLPARAGALLDALGSVIGNPFAPPAWLPTRGRRRITARMDRVRALVSTLLDERIARPGEHDDIVAGIVRDRPPGWLDRPVARERVTRALVGALLAGHRVPAAAAGWLHHALTENPARVAALRPEAAVLSALIDQGLPVTPGAFPATSRFVAETLRLFPPTWLISRTLLRPEELAGHALPAGHTVLVSPYVVHRDPTQYDDPETFRPERWHRPGGHRAVAAGTTGPLYLPYGIGARACPGRDLAALTLVVLLLTAVDRFEIGRGPGAVEPDPRTTLLPRGLDLRFVRR